MYLRVQEKRKETTYFAVYLIVQEPALRASQVTDGVTSLAADPGSLVPASASGLCAVGVSGGPSSHKDGTLQGYRRLK